MANESAWWKYDAPGSSVTGILPALVRSGSISSPTAARPMPSMPFSVCRTTPRVGVEVVGDQGGLADAEVDVRRRAGCRGRPRGGRSRPCSQRARRSQVARRSCRSTSRRRPGRRRCPGVTTTSGSSSPDSTTSRHLRRSWSRPRSPSPGRSCGRSCGRPGCPSGRRRRRLISATSPGSGTPGRTSRPSMVADLLALGERRTDAGRAEERADARPGRAHPLGEVALRHHLELDLAGAVEIVEDPRVDLPRERADHLADAARRRAARPGRCRRCRRCWRRRSGPWRPGGSARRSGPPACRPSRTRRSARSSRPRCRRPPRRQSRRSGSRASSPRAPADRAAPSPRPRRPGEDSSVGRRRRSEPPGPRPRRGTRRRERRWGRRSRGRGPRPHRRPCRPGARRRPARGRCAPWRRGPRRRCNAVA